VAALRRVAEVFDHLMAGAAFQTSPRHHMVEISRWLYAHGPRSGGNQGIIDVDDYEMASAGLFFSPGPMAA
jgi:hypothetical protein